MRHMVDSTTSDIAPQAQVTTIADFPKWRTNTIPIRVTNKHRNANKCRLVPTREETGIGSAEAKDRILIKADRETLGVVS